MSNGVQMFIPGYLPVKHPPVCSKATPEQKWKCSACGELHDDEFDAGRCCPPEELWLCPACGDEHGSEKEATECCAEPDEDSLSDFYMFPATTDPQLYIREFCRINFLKL